MPKVNEMLAKFERRMLDSYQRHHRCPPTFIGMVGRLFFRSPYLIAHAILWALAYLSYTFDQRVGFMVLGISLGLLIRDLSYFIRFVRAWPLFDSIIDWAKIEELSKYGSLSENDQPIESH